RSILEQIYSHWELIIVDDGSRDGTKNLFSNINFIDSRIKFLERPHNRIKGANSCRNIGIENANGMYVAFLDSDDEWLPWRIKRMIDFLKENKVLALYSDAVVQDDKIKRLRKSRPMRVGETAFDFLLSNNAHAQTSTYVVHSNVLKK